MMWACIKAVNPIQSICHNSLTELPCTLTTQSSQTTIPTQHNSGIL